VQVGLHPHHDQRLVHPTAALQRRREERAGAQLRDPQLQIPRRRRQHPAAVAVAQVAVFRGTLVRGGADQVGELGLDQRLVDGLGRGTDPVADIGDLECVQDVEQGGPAPSTCSGTPSRPGLAPPPGTCPNRRGLGRGDRHPGRFESGGSRHAAAGVSRETQPRCPAAGARSSCNPQGEPALRHVLDAPSPRPSCQRTSSSVSPKRWRSASVQRLPPPMFHVEHRAGGRPVSHAQRLVRPPARRGRVELTQLHSCAVTTCAPPWSGFTINGDRGDRRSAVTLQLGGSRTRGPRPERSTRTEASPHGWKIPPPRSRMF
jgi:hypothetical protein